MTLRPRKAPSRSLVVAALVLCGVGLSACGGCGGTVAVGNRAVERVVSVSGALRTVRLTEVESGRRWEVNEASEEFVLVLRPEARLTARDFRIERVEQPQPAKDGRVPELVVHLEADSGWRAEVRYWTEGDAPQVYKSMRLWAPQADDTRLMEWTVDALTLEGAVEESPRVAREVTSERQPDAAMRYRGGLGLGQPLYLGGWTFAGLEHPGGHQALADGRVTLTHFPGPRTRAFPEEGLVSKTAVWGVAPAGQVVEAFRSYLRQRIRAPRRMRHFIDAYHLRGRANLGEGINAFPSPEELETLYAQRPALRDAVRTEANAVAYAQATARFAAEHGLTLDAFVVDGGWQDARTVFELDRYFLPNGFAPLKQAAGVGFGLWNSLAGFRLDLRHLADTRGFEICPPAKLSFDLSQPQYQQALREALTRLAGENDVVYWKQDFNFFTCPLSSDLHPPDDPQSFEASTDAMRALIAHERSLSPDVFINQTTLIWPSPWWLMSVDALPSLTADYGYERAVPSPSPRDWHVTWVDRTLYRMFQLERAQFPTSRLMTHGLIQDRYVHLGGLEESLASWASGVVAHLAPGLQLQELYLDPAMLPPTHAQFLAAALRWADAHAQMLGHFGEMFGGNPQEGQAYGFTHAAAGEQLVFARNPSHAAQTLQAPVQRVGTSRVVRLFPFIELVPGEWAAGSVFSAELGPFESSVFQLLPTDAVPAWLEEGARYGLAEDGAVHRRGEAPAPLDVTVTLADARDAVTVEVPTEASAARVLHLLFDTQDPAQVALSRDGAPLPEAERALNSGPCGPLGCPLSNVPAFAVFRVPLSPGVHTVSWTLPERGARLHGAWVETAVTASSAPVPGAASEGFLPTPFFRDARRWQLVYSEFAAPPVTPKLVSERLEAAWRLDALDVSVALSTEQRMSLDPEARAGGAVRVPLVLDPVAKTVRFAGSQATVGDAPTGGLLVLYDVPAVGTVRLTLGDYEGTFDPGTGAIAVPVQLVVEAPSIADTPIPLESVLLTGVSSLTHKGATAVARGQVLAEDDSLKLSGTTVIPESAPLVGDHAAAVSISGRVGR